MIPAVVADDLSLHYPVRGAHRRQAVSGVSFRVEVGDMLAVIGESGSGKSTLAAALAGHAGLRERHAPVIDGGSLRVLGYEVRDMSERTRDKVQLKVGYLRQNAGAHLDPHLTAGENIAAPIFARDRRFDEHHAGQAVATLVDAVRLPMTMMNRYPYELSTGQRQRVAIAQSLILEPILLIADNPTAGVDVTVRMSIIETLRDVREVRDFSAVVIADELDEVRALGPRVLVMHDGLVAGDGALDDILADPWHPYTAGLARARELMTERGA